MLIFSLSRDHDLISFLFFFFSFIKINVHKIYSRTEEKREKEKKTKKCKKSDEISLNNGSSDRSQSKMQSGNFTTKCVRSVKFRKGIV